MIDNTLNAKTVRRLLCLSDFDRYPNLKDSDYKSDVLNRAAAIGVHGFGSIRMNASCAKGKSVFHFPDLAQILALRHVSSKIRQITGIKPSDRNFIVECLKSMCQEAVPFYVHRFDIKSFYESVKVEPILKEINNDIALSGQTYMILESLFEKLERNGTEGLPRGLPISATLSEYIMRPFDSAVEKLQFVWFYARFVDDIIIITEPTISKEEVYSKVQGMLPKGLRFNEKYKAFYFSSYDKSTSKNNVENEFDFLGYNYKVSPIKQKNSEKIREVHVDLSVKKINKIKTRLVLSFVQFKKDRNYANLIGRVRLLTSNFSYIDKKTSILRTSGIYYSYPLLDLEHSNGIAMLDRFLINIILNKSPKNKLRPFLTTTQKKAILRLRFDEGFKNRRFFHFSYSKLSDLVECWKYA